MEPHTLAGRLLGLVPRTPAELRAQLDAAGRVLEQDHRLFWSAVALVLAGLLLSQARRAGGTVVAVLAVAVTSAVWFRVNQPHEGVVLLRLSDTHGITQADLLVPVVVGLALIGWAAGQSRRRRRIARVRRRTSRTLITQP